MPTRYDVVQPYSYQRDGKEVTKWQRVGSAFPKYEEGRIVGFTVRFTNSPPFPAMVVVSERKERDAEKGETRELNLDKNEAEVTSDKDAPF